MSAFVPLSGHLSAFIRPSAARWRCLILVAVTFFISTVVAGDIYCPNPDLQFACDADQCISADLQCDGVKHCLNGQDEVDCLRARPAYSTASSPQAQRSKRYHRPPLGHKRGKHGDISSSKQGPLLALSDIGDITYLRTELESESRISTAESSTAKTEISVITTTTTTTQRPPTTTTAKDDGGLGTSNSVDIVSIVTVMVIFCVTLVVCMVLGCRSRKNQRQGSADVEQVSLTEENSNPGYEESDTGRPSTPPPSYSVIERQTSYASYISQSSSQMSVPPDYDEAVELPTIQNGRHRPRQSSAPNIRRSRSNRAQGSHRIRVSHPSTRLFSRSISATEPRGDRFRSLSSTAEAGEVAVEAAENPSLPRNSSEPVTSVTDLRPRITSEDSSVFMDNDAPPSSVAVDTVFPPPSSPTVPSPSATDPEGAEHSAFAPQPENVSSPVVVVEVPAPDNAEDRSSNGSTSRSGSSPSRSASPPTPEAQDSSNASAFALLGNEGRTSEGGSTTRDGPNSTSVSFYVDEDDER